MPPSLPPDALEAVRELLDTLRDVLPASVREQTAQRFEFRLEQLPRGASWVAAPGGEEGVPYEFLECLSQALAKQSGRGRDPAAVLRRVRRSGTADAEDFAALSSWASDRASGRAVQWFQWKAADVIIGRSRFAGSLEGYLSDLVAQAAALPRFPELGVAPGGAAPLRHAAVMAGWVREHEASAKLRFAGVPGRRRELIRPRRQRVEMFLREALKHLSGEGSPIGFAFYRAIDRGHADDLGRWLEELERAVRSDPDTVSFWAGQLGVDAARELVVPASSERRFFGQLVQEWEGRVREASNRESAARALGLSSLDLGGGPLTPGWEQSQPPTLLPRPVPPWVDRAGALGGSLAVQVAALAGLAWVLGDDPEVAPVDSKIASIEVEAEPTQPTAPVAAPSLLPLPNVAAVAAGGPPARLRFGGGNPGVVGTGPGSELAIECNRDDPAGTLDCTPVFGRQPPGTHVKRWLFEGGTRSFGQAVADRWGDPDLARADVSEPHRVRARCPEEATWCEPSMRAYSASITLTNPSSGPVAACIDVPFHSEGLGHPRVAGIPEADHQPRIGRLIEFERCDAARLWWLVPGDASVTLPVLSFFDDAAPFVNELEVRVGFSAEPPDAPWFGRTKLSVANATRPAFPYPSETSWPFVLKKPVR